MANGKPGDHPYTDIVTWGRRVYSPQVDQLVREIHNLSGGERIASMLLSDFNEHFDPDIPRLERLLTAIRDELLAQAKQRGWEVPGGGS
jgi:hypothetical protein